MKLGNLDIKDIYVGSTPAAQVYFGDVKVWPEETPILDVNAVKFENIGSTTGIIRITGTELELSDKADWEYSSDGSNWTQWDKTTKSLSVDAGDRLYIRAGETGQSRLATSDSFNRANKILPMSSSFKVSGPLSSLLSKNGTIPAGPTQYQFASLFLQGLALVDASELEMPSTVAQYGYARTFGITSLSAAPALPATTLNFGCYYFMFGQCTSLSAAPALPATALESKCYENMFYGCTALTAAPNLFSNTTNYCYSGMFYGCTSLTQVPDLYPYQTSTGCYANMFNGCTGLTNAGRIRTGNGYMYNDAYMQMFANCTNITAVSFPNAYDSELKLYIKDDFSGMKSTFENCDPSTIFVTYANGADWLSAFMPQLEGVKFTATSPYTNISIQDVGNAANAGGICDVVYSTDGENWTNYTVGDTITLENTDDYVIFKAASESNSGIMSISSTEYFKFVVDSLPLVEGDLKYLYTTDPDNYYMTHDYQFTHLFDGCYFAIQYNGTYSSLTMPSQDNWIYSGVSYVFAYIFYNAQIARIKIPSSNNSNDWNAGNSFYWWVAGIYTDGETGILTLPSFYSITYGESSIPNGWSYEQIS